MTLWLKQLPLSLKVRAQHHMAGLTSARTAPSPDDDKKSNARVTEGANIMADNEPDTARFDHREIDVTFCCERLCCGETILTLGEEEVMLHQTACFCCDSKKRGPYGELGAVDSVQYCCLSGFAANSIMTQQNPVQLTGFGCEKEKVADIVAELKKRQAFRGGRAKIRIAESTLQRVYAIHEKMDLIMDHLQIRAPEVEGTMDRGK